MSSQTLTCRQTLAVTSHRVLASDLNEHGTVYGGRLLEILDGTASISASRIGRASLVTASLDELNFILPFKLDDSFCIETYVTGTGTRSIEVFAKIIGEHLNTGERYLGATAFLTFVVPDKKVTLGQIIPVSEEEQYICAGYPKRRQARMLAYQQQKAFQAQLSLKLPWEI